MKEEMKYEEAMQRLETIVSQIENDELGIDELTARLKEAKQMLKTCSSYHIARTFALPRGRTKESSC